MKCGTEKAADAMKRIVRQYMLLLVGVLITSFAISVFYTPNKIVSGGVSGTCRIADAGRPYAPAAHRTPPQNIITGIVPGLQDRKHIPGVKT